MNSWDDDGFLKSLVDSMDVGLKPKEILGQVTQGQENVKLLASAGGLIYFKRW